MATGDTLHLHFWNNLYLLEALLYPDCCDIFLRQLAIQFKLYFQVAGHFLGAMIHFLIMGSISYYLESYVEGYIGWDFGKRI